MKLQSRFVSLGPRRCNGDSLNLGLTRGAANGVDVRLRAAPSGWDPCRDGRAGDELLRLQAGDIPDRDGGGVGGRSDESGSARGVETEGPDEEDARGPSGAGGSDRDDGDSAAGGAVLDQEDDSDGEDSREDDDEDNIDPRRLPRDSKEDEDVEDNWPHRLSRCPPDSEDDDDEDDGGEDDSDPDWSTGQPRR